MNEPKDTRAAEVEIDEQELRRRSDQIIESIGRLSSLEVDKREIRPGSPEFVGTATSVKRAAQELLDLATDEERLAERLQRLRQEAHGAVPERSISEVPGARPIQTVLAEWRDAERRLMKAEAGTEAEGTAKADAERLRAEYQRAAAKRPGTI